MKKLSTSHALPAVPAVAGSPSSLRPALTPKAIHTAGTHRAKTARQVDRIGRAILDELLPRHR